MKSAVLIAFTVLVIFIIGCKKDNSEPKSDIEGKWELVRVQGGRAAEIYYPAGNGNILKFTNSKYEAFENGRPAKSGSFAVINDPFAERELCLVLPDNTYRQRIIYNNDDNSSKVFYQIKNDTLSLLSGCFASDAGLNKEYVKR
ncbi:hypothetical protein [Segetibacter sp.]|jgi:hypothetical protein|uniref:hypothetical protein n=1 Tax=Segetibacter sp. TaxID=2231182 RepID=UPI00262588B5|nr:hypothetical protein [Segetibacter sp.]MCW3080334.1 hypothetical protein [Segetibacter sp.]